MYISQSKLLQYTLYSNAIYVFLFFLFLPDGLSLQKIIITSFLAFSVVSTLILCFLNRKTIDNLPKTQKRIFIFLMVWSTITIVRSFSFQLQDWLTNFGNVYMALAWYTPLFIIIGQKIKNWAIVFKSISFMFQLMLVSLFFLPFLKGYGKLRTEWSWLLRPINFIFIIGVNFFKTPSRVLVFTTFAVYILIAILAEQRIEFIYLFLVILLVFTKKIKQIKIKRTLLRYVIGGFSLLVILIFTYGYGSIANLVQRFVEFQDSRIFLYNELFEDLNSSEEIFGRGSLGTYYSYYMEHTKWYIEEIRGGTYYGDSSIRITIEVGYLQMILKGGFILFVLTLFLMLSSSYLAIFKSKNRFVISLGIYILVISILSLISFRPAFTPTFIILWMAVGTVLNKKYRNMSDNEINKLIRL